MTTFLDKKERVIDLKLTSYGKYLFSIGTFKPAYYAFYDDNIIYDGAYAGITESQNNIHNRIKNNTSYFESLVLFEDVDNIPEDEPKVDETGTGIISVNTVPKGIQRPRFDNFRYDNAIGDSLFDGRQKNLVPSWKIVSLNGNISSSAQKETETTVTELNIPQVNISLRYYKKIVDYESIIEIDGYPAFNSDPNNILSDGSFITPTFSDNKVIVLEMDDPMIYVDEVNTQVLTENFDIEVFCINEGEKSELSGSLKRLFFKNKIEQVVDGLMISEKPEINYADEATPDSIEYYFDILKDKNVDHNAACKGSEKFNKQTYYISLDFDCEQLEKENFYNDIYGSEVIPQICLD